MSERGDNDEALQFAITRHCVPRLVRVLWPYLEPANPAMRLLGIGGHQSARMDKDEWLTPPEILAKLGSFDLDPCAPMKRPWDTAKAHFTYQDNGLMLPWDGRVWLNPPYGNETGKWLGRLAEHGDGIALVFARTETEDWIRHIWGAADAIMFLFGRLYFHHANGDRASANSGAPSALIAYGRNNVSALKKSGIPGAFLVDWASSRQWKPRR